MTFNKYMCLVLSAVSFMLTIPHAAAYDPLDPNGNITLKWDVISWTSDGYVAVVTMNNFQMYRHIMSPGWTLGWVWAKKEVIWSMVGAQAVDQGDCTKFKGNIPHCCMKNPTVVDLLPGVPYNQQIANCCKAGVVASWGQDPSAAVSSFQLSVGRSGTSNKTVRLPKNFTLLGPGPGYTCSQAKIVRSTVFNSLTVAGVSLPNLLCLYVIILQLYNHSLSNLCLWWVVCTNALGAFDFHVFLLRAETETESSRFAGGEFMTIEREEEEEEEEEEERRALCCQFSNTCKVFFFLKETPRFKVLFGIIGKLRIGPFA